MLRLASGVNMRACLAGGSREICDSHVVCMLSGAAPGCPVDTPCRATCTRDALILCIGEAHARGAVQDPRAERSEAPAVTSPKELEALADATPDEAIPSGDPPPPEPAAGEASPPEAAPAAEPTPQPAAAEPAQAAAAEPAQAAAPAPESPELHEAATPPASATSPGMHHQALLALVSASYTRSSGALCKAPAGGTRAARHRSAAAGGNARRGNVQCHASGAC